MKPKDSAVRGVSRLRWQVEDQAAAPRSAGSVTSASMVGNPATPAPAGVTAHPVPHEQPPRSPGWGRALVLARSWSAPASSVEKEVQPGERRMTGHWYRLVPRRGPILGPHSRAGAVRV